MVILFAAGICWLQFRPELPSTGLAVAALLLAVAGGAASFMLRRRYRLGAALLISAAAFLFGAGWAALLAQHRLNDALGEEWEGRDIQITGTVVELPQFAEDGIRFAFAVDSAVPEQAAVPRKIRLSWYDDGRDDTAHRPQTAGERWMLTVRLKRPHGLFNPGSGDYEAWLLERGLRATGYIRANGENRQIGQSGGFMIAVHRLRGRIRERIRSTLPDAPYAGMLIAITVGDQRAIPSEQWQVFRKTGISHLVAISGLHVSFAALLCGGLLGFVWRRIPALALRLPARKAMIAAALIGAVCYALLAGMGIPVRRATIMLAIAALAMLSNREIAPSRTLALALAAVLLFDPWAVLAAGFWLSFGAVAVITLILSGRHGSNEHALLKAARLQLAITLALVPLLLLLFQSYSLVSPLANAIAIPIVSLVVTPLALLSLFMPTDFFLWLSHGALSLMMGVVEHIADWPLALQRHAAPPLPLAVASTFAAGLLLLPRGTPGTLACIPVFAALLLWQPDRPGAGEFRLTLLDVGNALAVHIQTASRDMLYDSGPAYRNGSDAGERVVLPYLSAEGVSRLDLLLVSHDDTDHSGGGASIIAGMPVGRVSGFAADALSNTPCRAGQRWQWDGVDFEILHPLDEEASRRKSNDDSCVLRIASAYGSALLTGDIGRRIENRLTARIGEHLASDVVAVAHHGSKNSSSASFVEAVRPRYTLYSSGYRNRFGHPHPDVWARWQRAGAVNLKTDAEGALRIDFRRESIAPKSWRQERSRYWHGR